MRGDHANGELLLVMIVMVMKTSITLTANSRPYA